MRNNTVTQSFYSAYLTLWRYDEEIITPEQVEELRDSINEALCKKRWDCVENTEIVEDNGTWYLYLKLGLYGDSYYDVECEYEPYRPATMFNKWGDPGDPAEGGTIECYSSTQEMLSYVWKLPDGWDIYDVDEEDMDDEERLWQKLDEYFEPDPDRAYEEWRDAQLEQAYEYAYGNGEL